MNVYKAKVNGLNAWIKSDITVESVAKALTGQGQLLKESPKSLTARVGDWVVKRARIQAGLGPIKRSILRNRYRRPWNAATYLLDHNVLIPTPIAWLETTFCWLILDQILVCQFLDGFQNVEVYAKELVKEKATSSDLGAFFTNLATAVNNLNATGAYHADLSGKNIFTKDGKSFYFIDFDDISLGAEHSIKKQLKNHVQLYDSFCDFVPSTNLDDFILKMTASGCETARWLEKVRQKQQIRRNKHIH